MTEQLREESEVDAVSKMRMQNIAGELPTMTEEVVTSIGTVAQQRLLDVSQIQVSNNSERNTETTVVPPTLAKPKDWRPKRDFTWQDFASCTGQTDLFFPPSGFESERNRERRERLARSICRECSVTSQCLEFALARREEFGYWGGTNENDRRLILSQRQLK